MVIEDDVEFRLMANEPSGAEDLFVESIAIWLRDPTPYYVAFPSECAGDADDSAP
jgi:hypothetical protein